VIFTYYTMRGRAAHKMKKGVSIQDVDGLALAQKKKGGKRILSREFSTVPPDDL